MNDVTQFGMVVIGDEILCGKRTDKHLPHVIEVLQARESDLVQLMDELSAGLNGAKLFSLPHLNSIASTELGFRGEQCAVEAAFSGLVSALTTRALEFECLQEEDSSTLRQTVV